MSKRSERRAAARAQNKLNRAAHLAQPIQAAEPTHELPVHQDFAPEKDFAPEEFTPEEIFARISEAQLAANRANAQKSTGPTSQTGKAASAQNHRSHGLTGRFLILANEDREAFDDLVAGVYAERKPEGDTEMRLAHDLIQHYWLAQRSVRLQEQLFCEPELDQKKMTLLMRYQATHERSYYKAQKELERLQKERRKESGTRTQQTQEAHEARTRLQHARATKIEIDNALKKVMEAPLPGTYNIPLEEIAQACSLTIATMVSERRVAEYNQANAAAA